MTDYDWEFQSPTARGPLVLMDEAEGKLRYRDARIAVLEGACSCKEFERSQEMGTDNEGYSRLIWKWDTSDWQLGTDMEPINFCPWCGGKVPGKEDGDG